MKKNIRYVAAVATAAAGLLTLSLHAQKAKATVHYINGPRADAGIPRPGMTPVRGQVAVVITDPQNDFLSTNGVAWGVVGQNVTENNTIENLESLFKAAKNFGVPVFVSPHYYYKHDHQWKFEGALEALMHNIGMFERKGPPSQERFEGSGADWLPRYVVGQHVAGSGLLVGPELAMERHVERRTGESLIVEVHSHLV